MADRVGFGECTCIGDGDDDDIFMKVSKGERVDGKSVPIGTPHMWDKSRKVGKGESNGGESQRAAWDDTRHMGVQGARAPFVQKGMK